jgi:hypothetical protein
MAPAPGAQPQTYPAPESSRLPPLQRRRSKQPSIGLLVGVALAFLVVGAVLAALVMRLLK